VSIFTPRPAYQGASGRGTCGRALVATADGITALGRLGLALGAPAAWLTSAPQKRWIAAVGLIGVGAPQPFFGSAARLEPATFGLSFLLSQGRGRWVSLLSDFGAVAFADRPAFSSRPISESASTTLWRGPQKTLYAPAELLEDAVSIRPGDRS